ncbi:hypothetical protein JCM11491_006329 [Sporobolomyces phaffii]
MAFSLLLPQLKTFAITCSRTIRSGHGNLDALLAMAVARMPKLEHLSLDVDVGIWNVDVIERTLFASGAGLKLNSLQMGSGMVGTGERLAARLAKVVRGEEETMAVNNVVVYALKGWQKNAKMDRYFKAFKWVETECIEGVEGRKAPFADFDGSF